MAEITLPAHTGRPTGSRPSNRLRAEGKVPATVYGLGGDAVTVSVDWRELRHARQSAFDVAGLPYPDSPRSVGRDKRMSRVDPLL